MPRKNFAIKKEKRSFWITDEAYLLLQALASHTGIETPAYLEVKIRDLAERELPVEQRELIKSKVNKESEVSYEQQR